MTWALRSEELGRRYRRRWALRSCSITIPTGCVAGLVGPNGSGKTTFLKLAAGLSRPTTGFVEVFGRAPAGASGAGVRLLGYLDQERCLPRWLRVEDLVAVAASMNGAFDAKHVLAVLGDLGVPVRSAIGRLSVGQQAIVAVSLALGKHPQLLLLDEPMAALDPVARQDVVALLMGAVAEEGTTVVMSSHLIAELEPVCDHLVLLAGSGVRLAGPVTSVLAEHRVLVGPSGPPPSVLGGSEIVERHDAGGQQVVLVRGRPDLRSPEQGAWQDLDAGLEEVVVGHLRADGSSGSGVDPAVATRTEEEWS